MIHLLFTDFGCNISYIFQFPNCQKKLVLVYITLVYIPRLVLTFLSHDIWLELAIFLAIMFEL